MSTDMRSSLEATTATMLAAVDRLADASFASPSPLPGWTIGHIVAHLHLNAEAIGRLVTWARTGVEMPMYASGAQRNDDIEAGAQVAPAVLRGLVQASARALDEAFDILSPANWEASVVTAQGRTVPATELVWMRTREVAVHAVDLGTGVSFDDLPPDVVSRLVTEIVVRRLDAGEGPGLAAWLTGRLGAGGPLGPWI
jgi:maleylpyruvate isomerase